MHNDPFSHTTSVTVAEHTHTHTNKVGKVEETKGAFVRATFISFSLMAFHIDTCKETHIHLQKNTVREEEQAHICFSMFVLLCKRGSLARVRLVSEGGPSPVYV